MTAAPIDKGRRRKLSISGRPYRDAAAASRGRKRAILTPRKEAVPRRNGAEESAAAVASAAARERAITKTGRVHQGVPEFQARKARNGPSNARANAAAC